MIVDADNEDIDVIVDKAAVDIVDAGKGRLRILPDCIHRPGQIAFASSGVECGL